MCVIDAVLSSSSPCPHAKEAERLREAVEWALENGDEINLFGGDGSIWKAELRRRVGEGNEK